MSDLPPKPWPKLSETLPKCKSVRHCQACVSTNDVSRYRECDDNDVPTNAVIVLCKRCWDRIGEPHPRAYAVMDRHEPRPGSMPICDDCKYRDSTRCTHPSAKDNGGTGVMLSVPKPSTVHIDYVDKQGRRRGKWLSMYMSPCTACQQKESKSDG